MQDIPSQLAKRPRVGIVGTGFMGRVHTSSALLAGAKIVGVAGSRIERARQHGIGRAFHSPDELIESGEIDVVHICTPNHLHAPLTLKALAAGLAVICEKPLATDAETAEMLAAHAAEAGLVATVPFVYRFHAMAREARQRIARGDLGRAVLVQGSYLQDWLLRPEDDNWRVDPELGGPSRVFADIGSHWCDLAEFITGDRITEVSAQTVIVQQERAGHAPVMTEDVVTVQFRTRGGALGAVTTSQVSPGRKNRLFLEVSGTEESIAFDQEQPEQLWVGRRGGSQLLMRDPETLSPAALPYSSLPAGHAQGYRDCFDAFVADSYAALRGEHRDGLPTFEDGARAARICAAVLTSARTGEWTPC
ncbi:Gfo/Idh/MocA family oxidoreductase [Streptosporangium sp. NPDC006013]|uniref:Gfo/Idh/MocA family protein n=1 Tax=Streptosporangium sp. NPDC006013 TaxID=3155596 RepID=UPI0033B0DB44